MIDFENKTITIPAGSGLNGQQVGLMVEQELKGIAVEGKLPEGKEHPYELQTIKIGERTGQETINVATSAVLLQRIQLKAGWSIIEAATEDTEKE